MATKYAEQAHLSPDFKMFEIKRSDEDISATKVRNAILNDDYKSFVVMTPLATLKSKLVGKNYYKELRDQINKVMNK
jgi:citrate lyase synthetase